MKARVGVPGRFSPDGRLIAVGLAEQGIALWDATDLTQVGAPIMETGGEVTALAFSPDGNTLAAVADEGDVTVWDLASRSLRYELVRAAIAGTGLYPGVAFSADGTTLVTVGITGLTVWDAATGARVDHIGSGQASDVALSADGTLAAFAHP